MSVSDSGVDPKTASRSLPTEIHVKERCDGQYDVSLPLKPFPGLCYGDQVVCISEFADMMSGGSYR